MSSMSSNTSGPVLTGNFTSGPGMTGSYTFPLAVQWAGFSLTLYIILQGVVGYVIAGIAVYRNKQVQQTIGHMIICLGISDLSLLLSDGVIMVVTYASNRWLFGNFGCIFYSINNVGFFGSSLVYRTYVALNRYLIICRRNHKLNEKCARILAPILSWVLGYFVMLVTVVDLQTTPNFEAKYGIDCNFCAVSHRQVITVTSIMVFGPITINLLCYGAILRKVRQSRKAVLQGKSDLNVPNQRKPRTQDVKLAKTFAVMFVIMCFGYGPFALLKIIDPLFKLDRAYYVFLQSGKFFAASTDPWLFGVTTKEVRETYREIIPCWAKDRETSQDFTSHTKLTGGARSRGDLRTPKKAWGPNGDI